MLFNHKTFKTMQNFKDKQKATAQPCVARKQPVGVLPPTCNKGFEGFASYVTKIESNK